MTNYFVTNSPSIAILMMVICVRSVEMERGKCEEANEFNMEIKSNRTHTPHTHMGSYRSEGHRIHPSGKLLADSGPTGGPQEGGIFFLTGIVMTSSISADAQMG
jgi:hypothetical protein